MMTDEDYHELRKVKNSYITVLSCGDQFCCRVTPNLLSFDITYHYNINS